MRAPRTTQRDAGKPRGEPGKRVSMLRVRPNMHLNKRIVFGISHYVACVGHARGHAVEDTASLTGRKFVAEK
jgi:hypothetical protein